MAWIKGSIRRHFSALGRETVVFESGSVWPSWRSQDRPTAFVSCSISVWGELRKAAIVHGVDATRLKLLQIIDKRFGCGSPLVRDHFGKLQPVQVLPAGYEEHGPRHSAPSRELRIGTKGSGVPGFHHAVESLTNVPVEIDERGVRPDCVEERHSKRILRRLLEHAHRPRGRFAVAVDQVVVECLRERLRPFGRGVFTSQTVRRPTTTWRRQSRHILDEPVAFLPGRIELGRLPERFIEQRRPGSWRADDEDRSIELILERGTLWTCSEPASPASATPSTPRAPPERPGISVPRASAGEADRSVAEVP